MKHNTLYKHIVIVFLTLALSNALYFYYYFHLLDLRFSGLGLFFLLLTIASWFLLFVLFKNIFWLIIHLLANITFFSYALINFVYFQVFDTFLAPTIVQAKNTDFTLINFVKEYTNLIPIHLFIVTSLLVSITITSYVYLYIKQKRITHVKDVSRIDYLHSNITAYQTHSANRLALIILVLLFNVSVFGLNNYTSQNPKESWWDQNEYVRDLGLHGFLYQQFFRRKQELFIPEIQAATAQAPIVPPKSPGEELSLLLQTIPKERNGSTITHPVYDSPNIIIYQLESIDNWFSRLTPSPVSYFDNLQKNNIHVGQFYANSCDTLNAEFSTLCSALPDSYDPVNYSYKDNDFYCLPELLDKEKGYRTALFHSGEIAFYDRDILSKKWGFQEQYFENFFGYKEPDGIVIEKALDKMLETPNQPFLAYIIGFSAHSPHNQEMIDYYKKHFDIDIKSYEGAIPQSILDTIEVDEPTTRIYAAFAQYVDDSIKHLYDELDRLNLKDNTIVVIETDHRYYNFYSDNDLANFYNFNQLPFSITIPNQMSIEAKKVASHIDIAPTLLDLMDIKKPISFIGESLFSKSHPENALTKCLSKVDYVDTNVVMHGNVRTNQFRTLRKYTSINENQVKEYYNRLIQLIDTSDFFIQENRLTEGIFNNTIGLK